jgi:hypothetical protein
LKKFIIAAAMLLGSVLAAHAQTQQLAVQLTYTAQGTVQVYRAAGTVGANGNVTCATYSEITATATTSGPYVDETVANGETYCYYITQNNVPGWTGTSAASNIFTITVDLNQVPPAPTGLGGTIIVVQQSSTVVQ